MIAEVFISYSSEDRDAIGPIVQIVRALKEGLVFQDYASILPGERWRDRVIDAITKAKIVMVFWCKHAKASEFVHEEYLTGIRLGKAIVPILLDSTELPKPLREFQWIDFRGKGEHGGVPRFSPSQYQRSNTRYYPKDEHGELRDWDYERYSERESERKRAWASESEPGRQEVARALVDWLESKGL